MEITIAISIISVVIAVSSFVLNRKDKAIKDAKENNLALINYRLDKLDENVQKILDKLEDYDSEIDDKIQKAMKLHIEIYHKGN
jgi:peptidoglycan hydrolase CwlO-like protein